MRALPLVLVAFVAASACKRSAEPPEASPPPPSAGPAPTEVTVEGALHAVRCGAVTAEWLGAAPSGDAPKSFGVTGLRFRLADGTTRPFAPKGTLEFSDWSFDVFSPDCAWVALLTDRHGPYHAVKVDALSSYLGGAAPSASLVFLDDSGPARVHSGARWASPRELEFQAACCGGVDVARVSVEAPDKRTVVFSAPEAPKGVRRTAAGYEVVP